jgi:hypothetical protein
MFVSRNKQSSMQVPAQSEDYVDFGNTAPSARDISGIVPLSAGLFVARTREAGQ